MVSRTQVATFDCTTPPHTLNNRHKYISKCLGSQQQMQKDSFKWITLQEAMKALGHNHITLLKIDIEGFEFDVFANWNRRQPLPAQILLELHYADLYHGSPFFRTDLLNNLLWPKHVMSLGELALFVSHLANLGYGIVSREDNALCRHCTELTLLRVH